MLTMARTALLALCLCAATALAVAQPVAGPAIAPAPLCAQGGGALAGGWKAVSSAADVPDSVYASILISLVEAGSNSTSLW